MKTKDSCLFDGNMPMNDVQKRLAVPAAEVKRKSEKKCLVRYNGDTFVVSKEKEGYQASVHIPGYLFWVIWLVLFVLFFFVRGGLASGSASADSTVATVSSSVGISLVPAFILYWIFAEVYSASKKKNLARFCNEVTGSDKVK